MRLICGHEAICRALALAGVQDAYAVSQVPLDEICQWDTKDVAFVAWHSKRAALRRPENALASESGIAFVQLPASLASFKEPTSSIGSADTVPLPVRLCLPLGQLLHSLQRLLDPSVVGDRKEALAIAKELKRFCGLHWPGWFEPALDLVGESLQSGESARARALIEMIAESAQGVAVYEAFKTFFHGAGKDVVNAGPGPIRAAIGDYLVGEMSYKDLLEILEADRWWPAFAEEFSKIEQGVYEVRLCGFDPDSVLGNGMGTARQSLERFTVWAERLLKTPASRKARTCERSQLKEIQRCLELLMDTIQAIARERDRLRQEVHWRTERAADAIR